MPRHSQRYAEKVMAMRNIFLAKEWLYGHKKIRIDVKKFNMEKRCLNLGL